MLHCLPPPDHLSMPSQFVALRVICPDGSTADSPAAGNKGCLARPQSQRRTGKPCGPAPRQSGAGRNPWPPGKTSWHPPPRWSPFGWSRVAVWLRAGGSRTKDPAVWKAVHLPFATTFPHSIQGFLYVYLFVAACPTNRSYLGGPHSCINICRGIFSTF